VTEWLQIAGVVGNVKQGSLTSEPRAEIFQSAAQAESGGSARTLTIRSTADPRLLIPWLRPQIAQLDADLPSPEIETMRAAMASLVASQLFVMRLLALFAGIAITLAAIGIYSVLVYSVEQRTHEIGIRLALGAKRRQIMGLIIGRGLRLSIAGAVLGTPAVWCSPLPEEPLERRNPARSHHPGSWLWTVIVVALGAAHLPARRAVDQDPIATLLTG
jgi:predicted lysophospholipase L1 biosynthesis ABC-type transport system permease subunit